MRLGAVFPQIEIGADREAIRAFADHVSSWAYDHILAYDHVLGADPAAYPGWSGAYVRDDTFHEPMVLFGFLAAICPLELVTGVLVLPQRQAVLAAKQAAEVDILSGGNLRLGVGIGWNAVEYDALGQDFHTRGRRIEEQIAVMRRLWTEPTVDFDGRDHRIVGAGIAPLPLQRPIPVWLGAQGHPRGLRRVGRIADGWFPQGPVRSEIHQAWGTIRAAAEQAGRDPDEIGVEGRIDVGDLNVRRIREETVAWRRLGASHLSLVTMRSGLGSVDAHLRVLEQAADVVRDSASAP